MISLYTCVAPYLLGYQNDKTNFRRNASIFQDAGHKKFYHFGTPTDMGRHMLYKEIIL